MFSVHRLWRVSILLTVFAIIVSLSAQSPPPVIAQQSSPPAFPKYEVIISYSVAFSPDGRIIAGGMWNLEFQRVSEIGSVGIQTGVDADVLLWDADTGKLLRTLKGHKNRVNSVAFSPDGKVVASAGSDGTIRLWDVQTGQLLCTLEGHKRGAQAIAFSPDGKTIASADSEKESNSLELSDKMVKLWDAQTGKFLQTLVGTKTRLTSIAFSPDGRILAIGGIKQSGLFAGHHGEGTVGHVTLWDLQKGKPLRDLEGNISPVFSVAFSPDGNMLLTGTKSIFEGEVRLWDVQTGKSLRTLPGHNRYVYVSSVAFSPDGKIVAVGGAGVSLLDTQTGQRLRWLNAGGSHGVAFSPDGKTLVSGDLDDTVKLSDVQTGKLLKTLKRSQQ